MDAELSELLDRQHGVATSGQIVNILSRRAFETELASGDLEKLWHGVYGRGEPNDYMRLQGLDLTAGQPVPACLGTAAALYGFDTENPADLHVLSPPGSRLRSADGLKVHRRDGAPLSVVGGRPATAPEWTAIEVARSIRRPRALATLDAALRSGTCTPAGLAAALDRQAGRRGVIAVRELLPLADPRAESPAESEARLVMIDGGLPRPELQYELIDGTGRRRRLDFAWPDQRVAAEYDGLDWHSDPDKMRADRARTAALLQVGWTVVPLVFEDIRYRKIEMVALIDAQLRRARVA